MSTLESPSESWSRGNDWLQTLWRHHERLLLFSAVLAWAVVPYGLIGHYAPVPRAVMLETRLDAWIPYRRSWEFIYVGFLFMCMAPCVVVRDMRLLRATAKAYVAAYAGGFLCFMIFPVSSPRPEIPRVESFIDWIVRLDYSVDTQFNCFPSLHVAVAFIAAYSLWKAHRGLGAVAGVLAVAIAVSTLLLKEHYVADVLGGIVLAGGVSHHFLAAFHRRPHSAFPVTYWLLIPVSYVLAAGGFYVKYLIDR